MRTIILTKNNQKQVVQTVVNYLKNGQLVIFPSDTVYGVLTDAASNIAVEKLIKFKSRPPGKPISVFCDFKMLPNIVNTNKKQLKTINEILPGPFTVVLPSSHQVCGKLESENKTIGIRIPCYRLIDQLIRRFGKPITATSANQTGRSPHYSIDSLLKSLPQQKLKLIDLIVNAGKLPRNKPSTVVDLTTPKIKIVRQGDINFQEVNTYITKDINETKKTAQFILKKSLITVKNKPLIFIIEGDLGVGKTVFIKGIGGYFGIKNIVSPSYVVSYEYDIKDTAGLDKLAHFDLYNIQEEEELRYLGIGDYLRPGNIVCFEWGEKAGNIVEKLKKTGKVVFIKMEYINKTERKIKLLS